MMRRRRRDDLLLLKLLLIFLSQVLDDALVRLYQQTVLLVPLAVQQISLPCQRLIPALATRVAFVQLLFGVKKHHISSGLCMLAAQCICGLDGIWRLIKHDFDIGEIR